MSLQAIIEKKLTNEISLGYLEVVNESGNHSVPAGSESHFKVVVVSDEFEGQRLLQRHRRINQILAEELANQVHALAIHTFTDAEWTKKNNQAPTSPPCADASSGD